MRYRMPLGKHACAYIQVHRLVVEWKMEEQETLAAAALCTLRSA